MNCDFKHFATSDLSWMRSFPSFVSWSSRTLQSPTQLLVCQPPTFSTTYNYHEKFQKQAYEAIRSNSHGFIVLHYPFTSF